MSTLLQVLITARFSKQWLILCSYAVPTKISNFLDDNVDAVPRTTYGHKTGE